jgi:hypothetical protein
VLTYHYRRSVHAAAGPVLFQHRGGQEEAKALVNEGKVALILDGLDEMDEAARPDALRMLSDAPFRVVVLSRSDEMVQATGAAWLVGANPLALTLVRGTCVPVPACNYARPPGRTNHLEPRDVLRGPPPALLAGP